MANRKVATESALYLFGVSRGSDKHPGKLASPGVDGVHPVEAVPCGEFLCWVSPVDAVAFSRELESNMENLEWLAAHGVRHQQVVGEIADKETIVPARFGTLFSSQAALLKDVESRKSALTKVFDRIADSDEWGVKVFAEEQPSPATADTPVSSGREYLEQKAARVKKRPERADRDVQEFAEALDKVSTESAPAGKVSGTQPGLLWQATFLVPRSKRNQWDRVLQDFLNQWEGRRRIEVTGPWPPYSFVSDAK
ncbi:MAG TPA: GvpL/GvpF family gas vesicle protein [Candidatus Acidoferrales bacterium]|nr:GvpL/GvpF family gas vesicle protein [Candidatus Acidoferrales bacterium]